MSTYAFQENGRDLAKYLAEELDSPGFLSESPRQRGGSECEFAVKDIVPDDALKDFIEKYFEKCKMTVEFEDEPTRIDADILSHDQFLLHVSVINYSSNQFRKIRVVTAVAR